MASTAALGVVAGHGGSLANVNLGTPKRHLCSQQGLPCSLKMYAD